VNSWRRSLTQLAGSLLVVFLLALPVLASEAAEEDPAASATGTLFRWLNFLLVFGGAGYLLKKHGGPFFRANAKAIAANITEASAAKAAADRELREAEKRVAHFDQEFAGLREAARHESAAEADRLRASGRTEIEKINQAARAELAAAERAAQQELRALAASMAVERAGALMSSRMTPETRARMFHAFLGVLGRNIN
jgi:F0F1-type ATP synthase membrane subunit b/b'